MSRSVIRPHIPYHGPIVGGLYDGKCIEIQGSIPYGGDMFNVGIATGLDGSRGDRPLQLTVRMNHRMVGINSMQRKMWGREENNGSHFPFHQGREFTISIAVNPVCYDISVNGIHCWSFSHRMPLHMVRDSSFSIDGHVNIERIDFVDRNTSGYPSPAYPATPSIAVCPPGPVNPSIAVCPPSQVYPSVAVCPTAPNYRTGHLPNPCGRVPPAAQNPCMPGRVIPPPEQTQYNYPSGGGGSGGQLLPIYNPKIPFSCPIPGGLRPGTMIYIAGRPRILMPDTFTINLQSSTATYPPPDIAFHFNVRFNKRRIVRNTRVNNVWGYEETATPHFPFHAGTEFHIQILVEHGRYMVAVDNAHVVEFRDRLQPLHQFTSALAIEGDVHITSITFG